MVGPIRGVRLLKRKERQGRYNRRNIFLYISHSPYIFCVAPLSLHQLHLLKF